MAKEVAVMNKTQKGAWFNLAGALFCICLFCWVGFSIFGLKKIPDKDFVLVILAVFFLITGVSLFYLRKKQSPKEPEADERDKLIQRNAVIAAFVSVWVLLFIANLSLQFVFGAGGLIPVWSLAIISLAMLYIVLIVCCVAVLVQYGRGGGGHE